MKTFQYESPQISLEIFEMFNFSYAHMDSANLEYQRDNIRCGQVILTMYNLPPELCMEQKFLFMSILFTSQKHLKRSLDIFLQTLIDKLKELWSIGASTYDCSTKTNFTMRAVLMWTISDFPAYGTLSGWAIT